MFLSGFMFIGRLRFTAILGLVFFGITAVGSESNELSGTMPEDYLPALKTILTTALKQAPSMIAKEIQISLAEAGVISADSARWPSFGGSGSYQSNTTAIAGNTSTQSRDTGLVYNLS